MSQEERFIHKLSKFEEDIRLSGDTYTAEDWSALYDEYTLIISDVDYMNFTDAQMEEIGRLQGRCAASFAKHVGRTLQSVSRQLDSYANGFLEGLKETASEAADGFLDDLLDF